MMPVVEEMRPRGAASPAMDPVMSPRRPKQQKQATKRRPNSTRAESPFENANTAWTLPLISISPDNAAAYFGWFAPFVAIDAAAASDHTRALLRWMSEQRGLLADLAQSGYFSVGSAASSHWIDIEGGRNADLADLHVRMAQERLICALAEALLRVPGVQLRSYTPRGNRFRANETLLVLQNNRSP